MKKRNRKEYDPTNVMPSNKETISSRAYQNFANEIIAKACEDYIQLHLIKSRSADYNLNKKLFSEPEKEIFKIKKLVIGLKY